MKYILSILLLLTTPVVACASWGVMSVKSAAVSGGVVTSGQETWDGTTEDSTWSTLPANWDDDYTGANKIDGDQSLALTSSVGSTTLTLPSSYDNLYAVIKANFVANDSFGARVSLAFLDSDDNEIVKLDLINNTTPLLYRIYGYHSGVSANCGDTSMTNNSATVKAMKLEYEKGSGSNGVVRIYVVDMSDYTTNDWANADSCVVTTTTDTEQINKIKIANDSTVLEYYVDSLKWSDSDDVDY